jgi:hypothetical protein
MGPQLGSPLLGAGASLLLIMPAVVGVFTAWFGYRKTFMVEQWRTTRLKAALEGAAPRARAEILKALATVEREHTVAPAPAAPPEVSWARAAGGRRAAQTGRRGGG